MIDWSQTRVLSFDCYGTLIDWETGILEALAPIFQRHGVEVEDAELLALFGEMEPALQVANPGLPYREVLEEVVRRLGERLGFAPAENETRVLVDSLGNWPPFADTVPALRRLGRRFRLAVLSNIEDHLFLLTARRLGIDFDLVVTAQQVQAYKPSPQMFAALRERLGEDQTRLVHVAQSLYHDIEPARALGIPAVWVNRPSKRPRLSATRAPQSEVKADVEVSDLAQLARLAGVS